MATSPYRLLTLPLTAHLGSGAIYRANLKPLRSQPVRKNAHSTKSTYNPRRVAIHGNLAVQAINPVASRTFLVAARFIART